VYGITIPAPASTVPPAPYPVETFTKGLQVTLSEVMVIGTLNEKISVMYWN